MTQQEKDVLIQKINEAYQVVINPETSTEDRTRAADTLREGSILWVGEMSLKKTRIAVTH